ncbi:MAG TPA: cytochrome c oxidase subunit II [Acidimicrobiales bacterium]|jgi:cytochrome c oxidase subunit 2
MPSAGPASPKPEHRSRPRRSRRWAVGAVVAVPLLLAGCQLPTFGAYRGATQQGHDSFKLWQGFFLASLVVGGIVMVMILWAVVRYRRRSDQMPRQTQYHTLFEITYTVVPIIIVLVLFSFTVVTENEVTATPKGNVDVQVTAFQWGWQFYYPATGRIVEGVTNQAPQMVVPTGETVSVTLKSADVIHGFYVPAFNYSEYAQPGHVNHFNFSVLHDGVYRGQCTQLCGIYHSLMLFSVKSVPPTQFDSWVHQVSASNQSINQLKAQIAAKGPGA